MARLSRGFRFGLLLMLGVCAGQIAWWVYDEVRFTREMRDRFRAAKELEAATVQQQLDAGAAAADLAARHPDLALDGGRVALRAAALAALDDEAWRRVNRLLWEGAFFLLTIGIGTVLLYRVAAQRAALQRREQNFLAAVSHELRSPLASIRLGAETLALREPLGEHATVLVRRILADTERLDAMIGNILQTSRIDDGGALLDARALQLGSIAAQVAGELEQRYEPDGVAIRLGVPAELTIRADPLATATILRNLLDNAAKAVVAARRSRVDVVAARANGCVTLTVRDEGIGFPPAEAERLFEKFYRCGDELRRTQPGAGLGLYIVRRLVELDGGRVVAHSGGAGAGAEFTVTWPAREAAS
jgi:signal transduction histidine kinase